MLGNGDLVAQFRQVCENLKAVMTARVGEFKAHGRDDPVYRDYFGWHYPAGRQSALIACPRQSVAKNYCPGWLSLYTNTSRRRS